MKYRNISGQYHNHRSFNSLSETAFGKETKESKTSERKHTQMSLIFHLFFLCLILTVTSCESHSQYDFKTSSDAISTYRDFHHSLCLLKECNAEQMTGCICKWQELSDTVYNYIKKDPAFNAHVALSMDFGMITDSVRTELMRLADYSTMQDVAYVKQNTSPYRNDNDLETLKKKAHTFYSALNKQPLYNDKSTRELLLSYQLFLAETKHHGIQNQKELVSFIETEDRHFRTFLAHIDEYSEMGLTDITALTEEICSDVYKAASEKSLSTEEVMVYMSMRTVRRLILNARLCHNSLIKGKVNNSSQANAYLWMLIQPYLSMDSFAITMLTEEEKKEMLDMAADYKTIVTSLEKKKLINSDISAKIPTQLMRLYISTL